MPVFAVAAMDDEKAAEAIQEVYPDSHKRLWPGLWFVADDATTQQVSKKLGIADGLRGSVFICSLSTNYWGFGPKDAWEWVALKRTSDR